MRDDKRSGVWGKRKKENGTCGMDRVAESPEQVGRLVPLEISCTPKSIKAA